MHRYVGTYFIGPSGQLNGIIRTPMRYVCPMRFPGTGQALEQCRRNACASVASSLIGGCSSRIRGSRGVMGRAAAAAARNIAPYATVGAVVLCGWAIRLKMCVLATAAWSSSSGSGAIRRWTPARSPIGGLPCKALGYWG